MPRRVLIMGAAGRDFHNFNVVYRDDPETEVVAFTATRIPYIDDRTYPAELAGSATRTASPSTKRRSSRDSIRELEGRRRVRLLRRLARVRDAHGERGTAAGANFALLGPKATMLAA